VTRSLTIRRAVLEVLALANPYALPESQLNLELNGLVRPPAGKAEFDEALLFLNSRQAIRTVPDDLDPDAVKWTIAEVGQALLRK
jgi:hypothetical protein